MDRPAIYSAIFSSRAQKEIAESWNWYEDRQVGLGDRFLKEITDQVHKIEQTPDRFPTRFKSYKEAPVSVFPFLIIYRINEKKENHSDSIHIPHFKKSKKEVLKWRTVKMRFYNN